MHLIQRITLVSLSAALMASTAMACDDDATPIFSCEASNGRKFIELCASSPLSHGGFLEYRFGSLDREGRERAAELVFPSQRAVPWRGFGEQLIPAGGSTRSLCALKRAHTPTPFSPAPAEAVTKAPVWR